MQKSLKQTVELPDGKKVEISQIPEAWWTVDDATGYVDPRLLAPDPGQPRKEMTPAQLKELQASIAECGVREALTVTPLSHAPWVRLKPEHQKLALVIVSGHRRDECAVRARIGAVPVRIRIYANEDRHRTDGGVLNACREDLTELEQGFEFLRENKAGKSYQKIADTHGINELTVRNRINLTKLHPDLQKLLDINPQTNRRQLPVHPAGLLGGIKAPTAADLDDLALRFADFADAVEVTGHTSFNDLNDDERRFALQKLLVAVMLRRKLSGVRAVHFILDRTLQFTGNRAEGKVNRYKPSRRKDVLDNFVTTVMGTVIKDWNSAEYQRIFGNASREEVEVRIAQVEGAQSLIAKIVKELKIVRDSKRKTSAEVLALMRK